MYHLGFRSRLLAGLLMIVASTQRVTADQQAAPSLRPEVPFSEHSHRTFSLRQGLPSNWVYDVVQTRDGYIWIATHNGLARYDGLRFKVFNRSNTPQLPANDTRVLHESRDGSLWIGTVGGLARYQSGRPGTFEGFPTFAGNSIHAICEDRAHTLWLGTREKTWAKAEDHGFDVVDGMPTDVKAICEDREGRLWFGADSGLYVQGSKLERITHPRLPIPTEASGGISSAGVNVLLADDEGGVWIGANRGLLYIKEGQFEDRGRELGTQQVYGMLQTRNGGLYAATRHGLQRSVGSGPFEKLSDDSPWCVTEDRDGGLWVGHGLNRGLHHFRNAKTSSVLNDHRVNCVHQDAEGNMWFGSFTALHCLRDEQMTNYGVADGLPNARVQTFAEGSEDSFWIGTRKGLARWSGTRLSTVSTPAKLSELNIAAALEDSTGALWLALASRGAYVLRNGVLDKLPGLDHGRTKWFHEESPGQLLIGHEYGLFRCSDDEITRVADPAFDRLNNSHFVCHYATKDALWMGTSGGIVRHRAGRFSAITSEDGLAADYIDRICSDNLGNLWFGGRDGFYYVNVSELNEVAIGQRKSVTSRRAEQLEGVSVSSNHPKGCLATDGTMWIAGRRGVIRVPPTALPKHVVPPLAHIETVSVDGTLVKADTHFEFLSGRHRLAIGFAAPNFTNPLSAHVKYRLDGRDDDWNDAGDERMAYYSDLGPGGYTFRVTADNGDEVWLANDETLSFTIRPRWWETAWFRAGAAIGIVGLSVFSTRHYTRHVRHRNELLQQEISERQRVEIVLRRSEERFRDLAESTQAIPWEADAATLRFTFVGNQAVAVLGYPIAEWLTNDFWMKHLHPDDRLEAMEFCQKAITRGESHQFEYRMVAADGTFVWIHEVVHVVMRDGAAIQLRGFLVDVTDRRQAEEKASDYLRQLARINRASSMGEMASSIAHEVNQPLFAVVGNAQIAQRLLNREPPDMQEVRAALSEIVSDGNRASQIIESVRALVRKEQQPTMPLDLNQVALEAIEFIKPEIRKRGLQLKTNLASGLPTISGNLIELQQVILNLIINAAQAMDNSSFGKQEMSLTTCAEDGFVKLEVQDHGSGIDQELADRLFEPFFTTKPQGTGMGLSINRTIVEAHHGRIWVESNEGHGAIFCFRLPVATEVVA